MKKVLNPNLQAGSTRLSNEPRPVGDIFDEMLSSEPLLAKAFRQSETSHADDAAEWKADAAEWKAAAADDGGCFRNTHLCSDVKTFLRFDRIAKIGKVYKGLLCRDADEHFTFHERWRSAAAAAVIRNPRVFEGKYINVTRRMRDGHMRFNFKDVDFGGGFCPKSFAIGVMADILKAFEGLGEEAEA